MTDMPASSESDHSHAHVPGAPADGSIKEMFVSLIISFVMALVFRSYVVEAFVIPTGSMAPTLLGAHMQFRSPQTGYRWDVNPWYESNGLPYPLQGEPAASAPYGPPTVTDPMTTAQLNTLPGSRRGRTLGYTLTPKVKRTRAGDRILVQKYLYELFPPHRWDVVVFKNPELVSQNFIKRLVGLPSEQLWIVDGDIFTRPMDFDSAGQAHPIDGEAWRIQRKPPRVQKALWRTIYSSEYAPLDPNRDGRRWFHSPWTGQQWRPTDNGRSYRNDSAEPALLEWDSDQWPVWDWVAYNEVPRRLARASSVPRYPVSDLCIKVGIKPDQPGLSASATITARGHEFQAIIADGRAVLRMRRVAPGSPGGLDWTELASKAVSAFAPGRVTDVEFWHADQKLSLFIDGRRVLEATYDWGPSDRLLYATGYPAQDYAGRKRGVPSLRSDTTYAPDSPEIAWSFSGSPLTLYRVGLDRDLYYEPAAFGLNRPGLATDPNTIATLGPDHYFVLGDNSPSSKDGRLWESVEQPVKVQIDDAVGVVHRKLMLGKAFFVYFPAPHTFAGRIPIPDFGRMRFIR